MSAWFLDSELSTCFPKLPLGTLKLRIITLKGLFVLKEFLSV